MTDAKHKNHLDSCLSKDSDKLQKFTPQAVTTARSRRAAALVFAVSVALLGLAASFAGIGDVWAVLASSVLGSVLVYSTWSVKTFLYDQTLETQDLVNLIALMKENPVREGILLDHLRVHSLNLFQLTYADANMLIERAKDVG